MSTPAPAGQQGILCGSVIRAQLITARHVVSDRTFEIEFLDAGVEAFCFTFG